MCIGQPNCRTGFITNKIQSGSLLKTYRTGSENNSKTIHIIPASKSRKCLRIKTLRFYVYDISVNSNFELLNISWLKVGESFCTSTIAIRGAKLCPPIPESITLILPLWKLFSSKTKFDLITVVHYTYIYYRGPAKCIISTAQHARPNVIGHNELYKKREKRAGYYYGEHNAILSNAEQ